MLNAPSFLPSFWPLGLKIPPGSTSSVSHRNSSVIFTPSTSAAHRQLSSDMNPAFFKFVASVQ